MQLSLPDKNVILEINVINTTKGFTISNLQGMSLNSWTLQDNLINEIWYFNFLPISSISDFKAYGMRIYKFVVIMRLHTL